MATFVYVCIATMLLVGTSSAAPRLDKLSLKIPEECKGKGFCSIKPEGYDELEDLINSLLPPHLIGTYIADRDGVAVEKISHESDWHNCPYITTTESYYGHSGENSTDEFFIQTNLFNQPIEVVKCAHEYIEKTANTNQQCFQHVFRGGFDMKTTCVTSNVRRTVFVLAFDPLRIVPKQYEVPCCCNCKITSSDPYGL